MEPTDKLKHLIETLNIKASAELGNRTIYDAIEASACNENFDRAQTRAGIWRTIMKSRITKFAAAAAIVIVVWGMVYILGPGAKSAYAVEETIAALRNVKTVHAFATSPDGEKTEWWVKINPANGENESWCILGPGPDEKWIHTPKTNFIQKGKEIHISSPKHGNILHFGKIMEYTRKIADANSIEIKDDKQNGKKVFVIKARIMGYSTETVVDQATKLLVRFDGNGLEGINCIDDIRYNEPFPAGLLDIEIPEDARVINEPNEDTWAKVQNDPDYGMEIGSLAPKDAATKLVKDYWQATLTGNWDTANKLRPSPEGKEFWKKMWQEKQPSEIILIETPRSEGSNFWVPCKIKFVDGQILEVELFIYARNIDNVRSVIITAMKVRPKSS